MQALANTKKLRNHNMGNGIRMLVGIPNTTHNEIAQFEIEALRNLGTEVATSYYGNDGGKRNLIFRIQNMVGNAITLRRKIKSFNAGMVLLHTAFDHKTIIRDTVTIFILKLFNRKLSVVLKFHGSEVRFVIKKIRPLALLKGYLLKKADLILLLSNEELDNFIQAGANPAKLKITANAIDRSLYTHDIEFKQKLFIEQDCQVLLFVGRFIKEKGILDLIEACKILKKRSSAFKLLCLGNGPLMNQAMRLIATYDLSDEVKLLGHIPEAETKYFYSNCDVLVLPTYHQEGFPMAVFQAVAAGKPVITTRIRAAADYLVENENCLWVQKEDPADLAEKIFMLCSNQLLRTSIGFNNLSFAKEFSKEKIADKMIHYFDTLLSAEALPKTI